MNEPPLDPDPSGGLDPRTYSEDPETDPRGPVVRDLERALRSEFGAYSVYCLLPKLIRGRELKGLIGVLRDDTRAQIERTRALIEQLGGVAPKSRWTRSVAAWALFFATPILGVRFSLRLCREAEGTVSRWYGEHAVYLLRLGERQMAEEASLLAAEKWRHSVRLATFVDHLRRGE